MLNTVRKYGRRLLLPHLSLMQKFMVLCAAILLFTAAAMGERISGNVQRDMARSTAFNTALYIASMVGSEIERPDGSVQVTPEVHQLLDTLFSPERLGTEIVAIKVWSRDGEIIYSTEPGLIGKRFAIGHDLEEAFGGEVFYEVGEEKEENESEFQRFPHLLEVYAPIRSRASGQVIGAGEVYQRIDAIPEFISASRREVWIIMALAFGLLYVALSGIVKQASSTIARQNAQLREANRTLEERAITDFVTGLYNHRYFQERLQDEILRASRFNHPLSLLFCDLDRFKVLNDTLGHQAGDLVLRSTADVIKSAIRTSDVAARYGGEEYAILLVEADSKQALEVADRIRCGVEARRVVLHDNREAQVTISIGVASFPDDAVRKEDLVKRADRAMYMAKNSGRNRVMDSAMREPV